MSGQLQTLLLAMAPINELRGTIPLALGIFKMAPAESFFWAVLGNILPIFFLLWFWSSLANYLARHFPLCQRFFDWLFERTRHKFYKKYSHYGDLALVILVAIPFPLTGAWTGSVAAFLFGIPYWRALGLIFLGILIAGIIVTGLSSGAFLILNVF